MPLQSVFISRKHHDQFADCTAGKVTFKSSPRINTILGYTLFVAVLECMYNFDRVLLAKTVTTVLSLLLDCWGPPQLFVMIAHRATLTGLDSSWNGAIKSLRFEAHRITVFIEDNQADDEVTALSRLEFVGTPVHTTNMNDLKKVG